MTILDMDEFAHLDPYIKDLYKKHIVDDLMPALMDAINKDVQQSSPEDKAVNEKEVVSVITGLARQLRDHGLKTIPNALEDSVNP